MRIYEIIKTNKPFLALLHSESLDDGGWYEFKVNHCGIKGTRVVKFYKTWNGEKPDPESQGWDIHTYTYVISKNTICLIDVDIP